MHTLARALEVNTSLEELTMSINQLTDSGLLALGESLKRNRRLHTLWLQELKKVTDNGLKQFVLGLQENSHLMELYVAGTAGGAEAVQHETEKVNELRKAKQVKELAVPN